VGSFFNFVPFRTDVAGARTFREVAERTRRSCLAAFTHEIPFPLVAEEAPELNEPFASDDLAVCAFQVFQFPFSMEGEKVGDLEYSEIRRRLVSQADSTDIPDGALFILDVDPAGDMIGNLGYNTNLFDGSTIADLVVQFRRTLREMLGAPDAPLRMDG
jgi:condensation enzyme